MILIHPDIGVDTKFFKVSSCSLIPQSCSHHIFVREGICFRKLASNIQFGLSFLFSISSAGGARMERCFCWQVTELWCSAGARLVAGVWAGSSLPQLAVILRRVPGRRVTLGRQGAASFPHARCHKVFAGPGGKILRWGGMLNLCPNWEDLEASGTVGDFPCRSGLHSGL